MEITRRNFPPTAPSRMSSATIERPAPMARQSACGAQRRKAQPQAPNPRERGNQSGWLPLSPVYPSVAHYATSIFSTHRSISARRCCCLVVAAFLLVNKVDFRSEVNSPVTRLSGVACHVRRRARNRRVWLNGGSVTVARAGRRRVKVGPLRFQVLLSLVPCAGARCRVANRVVRFSRTRSLYKHIE